MISRLLWNIGLFCRLQSLSSGSFSKETYVLREPTNRSHPIPSRRRSTVLTTDNLQLPLPTTFNCPHCHYLSSQQLSTILTADNFRQLLQLSSLPTTFNCPHCHYRHLVTILTATINCPYHRQLLTTFANVLTTDNCEATHHKYGAKGTGVCCVG